MIFEGSMVAIVTPFRDGRLDEEAFRNLIEWHIESGTDVIVPCGTTGESATLSFEEHDRVIELAVETVNGRVPVMAGTGSNNTTEAIRLTRDAKAAGADGARPLAPGHARQRLWRAVPRDDNMGGNPGRSRWPPGRPGRRPGRRPPRGPPPPGRRGRPPPGGCPRRARCGPPGSR